MTLDLCVRKIQLMQLCAPQSASYLNRLTDALTLPGTRHFAILHGTRGLVRPPPPRVWLLRELELRFKNRREACHETQPLTPEFKVLGQPVTSEVRSMTSEVKMQLADNFVSEQAI